MQRKTVLIVASIIVAISLAFFFFSYFKYEPPADEDTFREEYALVLRDYEGNEVSLKEFRREILIVYAWASWCPYCGAELEYLASLKEKYGEDLSIVAVNRAEPLVDAKDFTDKLQGLDKLVLLLDGGDMLYKQIDGYAMPETIFINKNGDIIYHQRGPITPEAVDQKVAELMQ